MTDSTHLPAIVSAVNEGVAAHLLLLFDFDGTLCEFAPTPAAAILPASRHDLLAALANRPYATAGVISGRRLADLRDKVGLGPPLIYAGLHGMEIEGLGERFVHQDAVAGKPFMQKLRLVVEQAVSGLAGVMVEDKEYSIVVHWRLAAPPVKTIAAQALSRVTEQPKRERRIRLQPGHEMCEVLPNAAWNKGEAVRWLERLLAVRRRVPLRIVYVGDDITDEDGFQAVGPGGVSVVVGKQRPTAARFHLPDPAAVEALLRMLVAMPRPKSAPGLRDARVG
jgi:trehalose 6-phosphate phosphatase